MPTVQEEAARGGGPRRLAGVTVPGSERHGLQTLGVGAASHVLTRHGSLVCVMREDPRRKGRIRSHRNHSPFLLHQPELFYG